MYFSNKIHYKLYGLKLDKEIASGIGFERDQY